MPFRVKNSSIHLKTLFFTSVPWPWFKIARFENVIKAHQLCFLFCKTKYTYLAVRLKSFSREPKLFYVLVVIAEVWKHGSLSYRYIYAGAYLERTRTFRLFDLEFKVCNKYFVTDWFLHIIYF